MSRFWDCTVVGCHRAAAIDIGICRQCAKRYCTEHITSPQHTCEAEIDDITWKRLLSDELANLRQQINVDNLLKHASRANSAQHCSLETSDDLSTCPLGGMHIHLRIQFADGTSWLARVPRLNESSFSEDLTNRILLNECASLKWLESIDIPTPCLHGYALGGDLSNDVGVAYMLIDQMPGKPFNRYSATEEQSRTVYTQWGNFMEILSQQPFQEIGSLTINPSGAIGIGPIVGDRAGTLDHLGPFRTGKDFYIGQTNEYLRLIADKQVLGRFSLDAYLMIRHIQSLVEKGKYNPVDPAYDQGPFYLKHTDDKGDHLLVDDDWNICGVIDWSFARVVPAYEAFGLSLLTANMDDIFAGRPRRSSEDDLLAQCLETSDSLAAKFAQADDRVRRFQFGVGVGMDLTLDEARDLFKGLLATIGEDKPCPTWEQWRQNMLRELTGKDKLLDTLLSQET